MLVMAYGGPESLEEIPGYLADIRAGRPTPRRVLDEITENYRAIGGRSPLLEVTRRQVDALQEELGEAFRCYLGMRHWTPWIEDVVGQMIEDDVTRAIGLVLAPQFSALSVAKYQQRVADGLELYRGTHRVPARVELPRRSPGSIDAFAARVVEGLSRWSDDDRDDVHVVFTAHSLPERLLANGDPYGVQCLETATLVAERAEISEPSGGRGATSPPGARPSPGRGPTCESTSPSSLRAAFGTSSSFRWDSSPITSRSCSTSTSRLAARADELGMRLERPPALNDDPVFIGTLAELVRGRAA